MAAAPTAHFGAPIRQHPGEIQVQRRVKVDVPGKHFTGLRGAEAAASYSCTAVEYRERYQLERHQKGWGAAHTRPGTRMIKCYYNWKYIFLRPSIDQITIASGVTKVASHE